MARPQIFDPDIGQDGEYRDLTDAEIREAAEGLDREEEGEGPTPLAPVVPEGGPTPTTNPNLFNFDEQGNPIVTTDPTTGQQAFQIRGDLLGGEIVDQRLGDPSVNPNVTTQQLDTRAVAINQGFQGTPTDTTAQAFIQDAAGQRGLVDPFGYQSAKGVQTDISQDPNAMLPSGARITPAMIDPDAPGTMISRTDPAFQTRDLAAGQTLAGATDAQQLTRTDANVSTAQTVASQVAMEDMEAEQFLNDIRLVKAQQEQVDERSTVKGQLGIIMEDFAGDSVPPWAANAIQGAENILARRGITASSGVYQEMLLETALKSGLPIAQADAQIYAQFQQQNLNNRQQAEITNAANLLTADIKELDIRQQTAVLNTQNRVQSLFTDAAEINATRKFNATSQNQTDQFFSNLQQAVNLNNSNQRTAISQFNANQANALSQFNVNTARAKDEFYARNQLAIAQANAVYRRATNTANSAAQNAANQFNATAVLNRSNTSLNNLVQLARDEADYIFNSAQNDLSRQNNLALATLQAEAAARGKEGGGSFLGAAGGILGSIFASFAGTNTGASFISKGLKSLPFFS
jgi:hypothetical protein